MRVTSRDGQDVDARHWARARPERNRIAAAGAATSADALCHPEEFSHHSFAGSIRAIRLIRSRCDQAGTDYPCDIRNRQREA